LTHPRANWQVHLDGETIACVLERSARRTIGLIVSADGLVVRAPIRASMHAIESVVQEKARWIVQKLQQSQQRSVQQQSSQLRWCDGAVVPYWGQSLQLQVQPKQLGIKPHATLLPLQPPGESTILQVVGADTENMTRALVFAWWQQQAYQHLKSRLDYFAPKLQVRWTHLALTNAATRWGSAKADGTIRLNWRLMHLAPDVADYVVVHELSHLREMNHSPRFWRTVESVMPDYAVRRQLLKNSVAPLW
jgi:predicted metal-dependent hydrolase